jgi:hypothetical protein
MLFKLSKDPLGNKYKFRKDNTMQIKMKETTRGSKHKEYDYTLEKIDLQNPSVRFLPDKTKLVTTYKINVYPFVSNSVGGTPHQGVVGNQPDHPQHLNQDVVGNQPDHPQHLNQDVVHQDNQ